MSPSPKQFDPLRDAMNVHHLLAVELQKRGITLDIIFHGTSGVISVFEPADWNGRGEPICDIFPMRPTGWFVEWRNRKTYDGQGGNFAFIEVLMRGIEENLDGGETPN